LGVSIYHYASYSVVVPGTPADSQRLCLSGTLVNKCVTVVVPETKSVTLTISYSANASTQAPVFTVGSCNRGYSIGVSGLTPGATVSATAAGKTLSEKIDSKQAHQSASFCKP
jgi:hypothetical protein